MILPTIKAYLITNASITDVRLRADNIASPANGKGYYLVIWEETYPVAASEPNGMVGIKVSCHAPIGHSDIVDSFILFELRTLLDRKVLSDVNTIGLAYQATVTNVMTDLNDLNDDHSVSRSRLITIPERWR